ncbi:Shwachman-Bodian-diamond syndrome protein [Piedraia hortae CBS 480.64]|uniref:Shwachman-Bodian-diamond syndrome protein n=1 Tax=Piedraia hortae CBS 480.64 TaxID=1314780 RepID=A0A6A7C7C6_9PEZI|nr:Shwachman-Bodian-diamond syndrome protein [Piedraia hortae CBS 480.64]
MPSAQINQPSNQIRLTNVSLVRIKRGKKKFEIACYKNTVSSFRSGAETDLDNVLQIPNIFLNVSKGQVAPNEELKKAFPGMSRQDVVLEILKKGEIQVGEKERDAELERIKKEVIEFVSSRVVDPKTKRVYTSGMVEKALDQIAANPKEEDGPKWRGVTTTKSAKLQALEAMKALIAHQPIPVARARMKVRVVGPAAGVKKMIVSPKEGQEESGKVPIKDIILDWVEQVVSEDVSGEEWEVVGFVEPGAFKALSEFVSAQMRGKARVEVLEMAVTEGD